MNVELLRKVKRHILDEPRRLVMGSWVLNRASGKTYYEHGHLVQFPKCGTVACIAGWTSILGGATKVKEIDGYPPFVAADLLGIEDRGMANRLFHLPRWPSDFRADYAKARGQEERAEVAAKRIDHFIRTNGKE